MGALTGMVDTAFGLSPSDGRLYRYGARQCPALQTAPALLDPAAGMPTAAKRLQTGSQPPTLISNFNWNAVALDDLGRFGGGGRAVCFGLDLVPPASGLSLTVSAGLAMIDSAVPLSANAIWAITDNTARTCIWLTQAGAISPRTDILDPPIASCYLGSVASAGGLIAVPDYSGVMRLRGGTLWRRTGEEGAPDDTKAAGWPTDPPSGLQFAHRTNGGWWWWDGVAYVGALAGGSGTSVFAAALAAAQDEADEQGRLLRRLLRNLVDVLGEDVLPGLEEQYEWALAEA
jgi:hypothetical protein